MCAESTALLSESAQLAACEISEALVICNPRAGRANAAALDRARKLLEADRITTELAITDGPGAATELARKAVEQHRQMIIVCGGDGSLNEVVNGMAGSQVPLALLPAGTANVMAKELKLPWSVERAAAHIRTASLRRIALGAVEAQPGGTRRLFLSLAGAGPDGAIVNGVNRHLKAHTGAFAYWVEGFRQLACRSFPQFRVVAGEKSMQATLLIVGRTKHYGGPFKITTEADLYSDEFELMACTINSPAGYLGYLPLAAARQLRGARHTHFVKSRSVSCEPVNSTRIYVQVDGEPAGCLPATFSIVPDSLTLTVPR